MALEVDLIPAGRTVDSRWQHSAVALSWLRLVEGYAVQQARNPGEREQLELGVQRSIRLSFGPVVLLALAFVEAGPGQMGSTVPGDLLVLSSTEWHLGRKDLVGHQSSL